MAAVCSWHKSWGYVTWTTAWKYTLSRCWHQVQPRVFVVKYWDPDQCAHAVIMPYKYMWDTESYLHIHIWLASHWSCLNQNVSVSKDNVQVIMVTSTSLPSCSRSGGHVWVITLTVNWELLQTCGCYCGRVCVTTVVLESLWSRPTQVLFTSQRSCQSHCCDNKSHKVSVS